MALTRISMLIRCAALGLCAVSALACGQQQRQQQQRATPAGKGDSYCTYGDEQCVAGCGSMNVERRSLGAHSAAGLDQLTYDLQSWIKGRGAPSQFCEVAASKARPGHRLADPSGGERSLFSRLEGRLPYGWQVEVAGWVADDAVMKLDQGWVSSVAATDAAVAAEVHKAEVVLWRVFTVEGLQQLEAAARIVPKVRFAFVGEVDGWFELGFRPLSTRTAGERLVVVETTDGDARCGTVSNYACPEVKWAKVDDGAEVRTGAMTADGRMSVGLAPSLCDEAADEGSSCYKTLAAQSLTRPDAAAPARQAFAIYLKLGTFADAKKSLKVVVDAVTLDLMLAPERWVAVSGDEAIRAAAVQTTTNAVYREQQRVTGAQDTIGQLFVSPSAPLYRCEQVEMHCCRSAGGRIDVVAGPCLADEFQECAFTQPQCAAFHTLDGDAQKVAGLSGYQVGLFGNTAEQGDEAPARVDVWSDAAESGKGIYFRINPDQPYYVKVDDILAARTPESPGS